MSFYSWVMTHTAVSPEKAARIPLAGQAIVELLNSRPHAIHADRLDDPDYAARVVDKVAPGMGVLTPSALEQLRVIRADLTAIATAASPDDAETGWRDFSARTSDVALQQDFSVPGEVKLRQVAGDPVVGGVALAVAKLVSSDAWSRVRICANPNCEGAFYDTTRSRTQRWDSYDTCGNRNNVAAYRARTRESHSTASNAV
jgi:predicted RNA-binding Zn ribbon-like protein